METTTKRLYEGLFLIDSGLATAQWDQVQATIRRFLDRAEATIVSMKKWDERKLVYDIKGKSRGTYILVYFECDPLRISGIERDVNLSEQVMRAMILRTDRMSQEEIEKATPIEQVEQAAEQAERDRAEADAARAEANAAKAEAEDTTPEQTGDEQDEPEQS